MKTNPYKAVDYKESAVKKALDEAGSLIADIKYDGVRLNLIATQGKAVYLSRTAHTIPALEHLNGFSERWAAFLADDEQPFGEGLMIDGEAMVKGVDFNTSSGLLRTQWCKKGNYEFNDSECSVIKARKELPVSEQMKTRSPFCLDVKHLKVIVYGVVPIDIIESGADYDVMNCLMQTHCAVQVALLERHFPEIEWVIAESHDVYDMAELEALYENVRELGHEGLVVKDPLGTYRRGKKTGWWKMKPEGSIDGTVCGLVWGTEGLANEGKVIGFEVLLENGVVVNACGITKELMDEFTGAVKAHSSCDAGCQYSKDVGMEGHSCAKGCLYESHPDSNPYKGHQVEVRFMEVTPDGSLRHPSFVCFRGTESNPKEKI